MVLHFLTGFPIWPDDCRLAIGMKPMVVKECNVWLAPMCIYIYIYIQNRSLDYPSAWLLHICKKTNASDLHAMTKTHHVMGISWTSRCLVSFTLKLIYCFRKQSRKTFSTSVKWFCIFLSSKNQGLPTISHGHFDNWRFCNKLWRIRLIWQVTTVPTGGQEELGAGKYADVEKTKFMPFVCTNPAASFPNNDCLRFRLFFINFFYSFFIFYLFIYLFYFILFFFFFGGGVITIRPCPNINGGLVNSFLPGQHGRHFADGILNAFSGMKSFVFRNEFHWSLFLIDPIDNKSALVPVMVSNHLNKCWPSSLTHICDTMERWVEFRLLMSNYIPPLYV